MAVIRDNNYFIAVYETAAQLKYQILELSQQNDIDPDDLLESQISTGIVYDISNAYLELFDILEKHNLLKAGYTNSSKQIH